MKFWWMCDNHKFRDLGENVEHAIAEARACFKEDPFGSLFARDPEGREMTTGVHGHGRGREAEFLTDLMKFRQAVLDQSNYQI